MANWVRPRDAVDRLAAYLEEFESITEDASQSDVLERARRWKERVTKYLRDHVSEEEAKKFGRVRLAYDGLSIRSYEHMVHQQRDFLAVLAQELVQHPDEVLAVGTYAATPGNLGEIFLSHAAADKPVAAALREQLMKRLPAAEVFLSSRPGHIRSGAEWWTIIQAHLRSAGSYVILYTPQSVTRQWIAFETGAAWMTGRPVYTVSAGPLDRSALGMPLSAFQINCLENPEEAEAFLADLGADTTDAGSFSRLIGAAVAALETPTAEDGWQGVQVGSRYFAWDGTNLHALDDRPPVPTPLALIDAIKGLDLTPSYGLPEKLESAFGRGRMQVFETDRQSWRREVRGVRGEQVLLVHSKDAE